VAEEGKHKVQAFLEHLPLINAICNPGLQERHWAVGEDGGCSVGYEVEFGGSGSGLLSVGSHKHRLGHTCMVNTQAIESAGL